LERGELRGDQLDRGYKGVVEGRHAHHVFRLTGQQGTKWLDYRAPQTNSEGQTYRSMRAQVQINCKARMARLTHMSYFSGGMLSGKEVQKQGMLRDWHEIEADSPMARIARRVC
jgi:hypothetical protein